jgi:hypothetical protein
MFRICTAGARREPRAILGAGTLHVPERIMRAGIALLIGLALAAGAGPGGALAQGGYQTPSTTSRPYQRPSDRDKMSADQKKAETFVAKLIGRAESAIAINQYAAATEAYEDALKVLEAAYGPHDVRLVEPLRGIVFSRTSWDSYGSHYGFSARTGLKNAIKAQERIVRIYDSAKDVEDNDRVAARVDLGDVYLYTDDERAIDTYRDAWKLQAELNSPEAADALFASVAMVRLVLPLNPPGHEEWVANVSYDVSADGHATVTDVSGTAPEWLATDIRKHYAEGRFRPRFVDGEPQETRGIKFSHKYVATLEPEEREAEEEE